MRSSRCFWKGGVYSDFMATKTATIAPGTGGDARYFESMDQCLHEIATIRRDMKKTDAEIRRLEVSTRRKLTDIRLHLHVKKAA
jgi:hypothetical protein